MSELETIESIKSGLVLPAAQAVITGLFSGGAVFAVSHLAGWVNPGSLAAAGGAVLAAIQWYSLQTRWQAARNFALFGPDIPELEPEPFEPFPGPTLENRLELNQPGQVRPVRVELTQDNGRRTQFINLPAKPEQLRSLAAGSLAGASLAVNTWSGSNKPFTRSEFETLRNALVRAGLARYGERANSPMELTGAGRAIFRKLAQPG